MNTTETDEMTFFERNGIRYEQRGDFLYPVLGACDNATITGVGKYGTLWMTWLFELDRRLHRKYLLEGTLIEKAMEFQEYACELENEIINATGISIGSTDDYLSVLVQQRQKWEVAQEIITHDGRVAIMKNKELREKEIKKRLEEALYERA
ncbi:MAG: TnpV protein [Lachnospiraceae bacterium]|nr:TnpV protein [Lachnospiraceae bacterium]